MALGFQSGAFQSGAFQQAALDAGGDGGSSSSGQVVHRKSLLNRIMETRRIRVRPKKAEARKQASVIVAQAAQLAVSDGSEGQFRALMEAWLAQKPVMPQAQGLDASALFMAQVAFQIERIRAQEQDDDDTAVLLLLH